MNMWTFYLTVCVMVGSVTGGPVHGGKRHVIGIVVPLRASSHIPGTSVAKVDGNRNVLGSEAAGYFTPRNRAGNHISPEVRYNNKGS